MTLVIERILRIAEPGELNRPGVERLLLSAYDACRHRLVCRTEAGTELLLDLQRGSYLQHGAIIWEDPNRMIVVERQQEAAISIKLSDRLPPERLVTQAVKIAHALGNQHIPLEVLDLEIRAPITTSRQVFERTIVQLGLQEAEVTFADLQLGLDRPLFGASGAHQ